MPRPAINSRSRPATSAATASLATSGFDTPGEPGVASASRTQLKAALSIALRATITSETNGCRVSVRAFLAAASAALTTTSTSVKHAANIVRLRVVGECASVPRFQFYVPPGCNHGRALVTNTH